MNLVDKGWISSTCPDCAEVSYRQFVKSGDVVKKMKDFTLDTRLDVFYMELLSCHVELREVVKFVLILSHGNARVEAGFSINEDALLENMSEKSLTAQRMVYDGVLREGGLEKFKVTNELMRFVREARAEYGKDLEKSKQEQTVAEKKKQEKRKLSTDLKKAKDAKQKCEDELKKKAAKYDSEIFNIQEQLRKR